MADTGNPIKRDEKGRIVAGSPGGPGRKRKRLSEDVEYYLTEALNIQGARVLVECMTSATRLAGKDAVEHQDWAMRIRAFEVIRDTVIGKPAQVITGEDGSPLFGNGDAKDLNERIAALVARATKQG